MTRVVAAVFAVALLGCHSGRVGPAALQTAPALERVVVSADGKNFELASTHKPFHPWGFNYGNTGRLMEDFWDSEWDTIAGNFRELRELGANIVRVHLQVGKFMTATNAMNAAALDKLRKLLELAQRNGFYLDITGLACYRPSDTPSWYDALDEAGRWQAQAFFWEEIARTCASSTAVFCYDLMNEPVSPGGPRPAGEWRSGNLFGGYDFIQCITLDPKGRAREDVAVRWIQHLTTAIRRSDTNTLVTVGLLPWTEDWKHLSGFIPEKIAASVDFISIHIYPDSKRTKEAPHALEFCQVARPVVIEEIFNLSCTPAEVEKFMRDSRAIATGWIGHYDGTSLAELNELAAKQRITIPQSMMRDWLTMWMRVKADFVGNKR